MLKRGTMISEKLYRLAIGGAVVFWVTTIATSLLPIAAQYRAAFSNGSIQAVWVGSLFGGMIIAGCVSYCLLRFYHRIPARNTLTKSMLISSVALIIVTALIDVPQGLQSLRSSGRITWFLIGFVFDLARFSALGLAIGYLHKRLYGSA